MTATVTERGAPLANEQVNLTFPAGLTDDQGNSSAVLFSDGNGKVALPTLKLTNFFLSGSLPVTAASGCASATTSIVIDDCPPWVYEFEHDQYAVPIPGQLTGVRMRATDTTTGQPVADTRMWSQLGPDLTFVGVQSTGQIPGNNNYGYQFVTDTNGWLNFPPIEYAGSTPNNPGGATGLFGYRGCEGSVRWITKQPPCDDTLSFEQNTYTLPKDGAQLTGVRVRLVDRNGNPKANEVITLTLPNGLVFVSNPGTIQTGNDGWATVPAMKAQNSLINGNVVLNAEGGCGRAATTVNIECTPLTFTYNQATPVFQSPGPLEGFGFRAFDEITGAPVPQGTRLWFQLGKILRLRDTTPANTNAGAGNFGYWFDTQSDNGWISLPPIEQNPGQTAPDGSGVFISAYRGCGGLEHSITYKLPCADTLSFEQATYNVPTGGAQLTGVRVRLVDRNGAARANQVITPTLPNGLVFVSNPGTIQTGNDGWATLPAMRAQNSLIEGNVSLQASGGCGSSPAATTVNIACTPLRLRWNYQPFQYSISNGLPGSQTFQAFDTITNAPVPQGTTMWVQMNWSLRFQGKTPVSGTWANSNNNGYTFETPFNNGWIEFPPIVKAPNATLTPGQELFLVAYRGCGNLPTHIQVVA